jgi:hypothetical protein
MPELFTMIRFTQGFWFRVADHFSSVCFSGDYYCKILAVISRNWPLLVRVVVIAPFRVGRGLMPGS